MPEPTPEAREVAERHDREAGRQLAGLCAVAGLLGAGFVVYFGAGLECSAIVLAVLGIALLAVLKPVLAIRIVSGRFSEAMGASAPDWVRKSGEGVPVEVGLAESALQSKRQRSRVGVVTMVVGAVVFIIGLAVTHAAPSSSRMLIRVGVLASLGGLVIWYRAK